MIKRMSLTIILTAFIVLWINNTIYADSSLRSYEPADTLHGYCGDKKDADPEGKNATYELLDEDKDGAYDTIKITGTGRMGALQKEIEDPSYVDRDYYRKHPKEIKTVYIDGVTNVGGMSGAYSTSFVLGESVTTIDKEAFKDSDLEKITFHNITSIGDYAFAGTKLTSFVIPSNASVGKGVFNNCKELQSITLNKTMTEIGENFFKSCTSLKSIVIPDNITAIGNDAFYASSVNNVIIPTSVKSIGDDAFRNCKELDSITINNGVETIGDFAFGECPKLVRVNLPDSVTSIKRIFYSDDKLAEITIPGSIKNLQHEVAYNCPVVKKIKFEEGVESVRIVAYNCPLLDEIYYPKSLKTFTWASSYESCQKIKTVGPVSGYNINYTWTDEIPQWAFYELDNLETATVANNITTIGEETFIRCSSLKNLIIADSVKEIGKSAFKECFKLDNISLSDNSNLEIIKSNAFSDCEVLESFHFPNHFKELGDYAFSCCSELKDITIPPSFEKCLGNSFYGCPELKTAGPYGDGNTYNVSFMNLRSIPSALFYESCFLESVVLPDNLESIGSTAFYRCYKITEVKLPKTLKKIGSGAFAGCYGLTEIKLPDGIEYIDSSAFAACYNIKSVVCPLSIIQMYPDSFYHYTVIYGYDNSASDKRSYGNSYISMGSACAVYFRDNHTGEQIKRYVLNGTTVGAAPVISVTEAGCTFQCWAYDDETEFSPDFNVEDKFSITFYAKYNVNGVPEFDPAAVKAKKNNSNNNNSSNSGKSNNNNNNTDNSSSISDNYYTTKGNNSYTVTDINNNNTGEVTYSKCSTTAKTASVGESVNVEGVTCKITSINDYAFSNCSKLKTLTIGSNIKKIGSNAFYGCKKLKKIVIKTTKLSKKNICNGAFSGLSKKTVIYVPKSKYKSYKKILKSKGFKGKVKK